MQLILDNVYYMDRSAWGANPALSRLGYQSDRQGVPVALRKTLWINHHTVVIDNDATKNVWETEAEIAVKMRQLQVIRPDLAPPNGGPDVPYNEVVFLMPGGVICVCEGRGPDRTGAHTHGYNTVGYGLAWQGNFEDYPLDVRPWQPAVNDYAGHLKETALPNLEEIGFHIDYKNTACPGQHILARRSLFAIDEEDDMEVMTRLNYSAVLKILSARALAGVPPTALEIAWARLVITAMEQATPT